MPEGLAFDWSARILSRAPLWNLTTAAGRLDVAFVPAGTSGYEHLALGAVRFRVFWVDLLASGLADILRSKQAADRPRTART